MLEGLAGNKLKTLAMACLDDIYQGQNQQQEQHGNGHREDGLEDFTSHSQPPSDIPHCARFQSSCRSRSILAITALLWVLSPFIQ